jgi:ribosomal protein S18 acetylase RimI-like enzyme
MLARRSGEERTAPNRETLGGGRTVEHFSIPFDTVTVRIRDIEEKDVDVIVDYLHSASPEYLDAINVDSIKLISREATASRVRLALPPPQGNAVSRAAVVAVVGEELVAYSNIHIVSLDETYAHVHIVQPSWRGRGLASVLFVRVMRLFVNRYGIRNLCLETSPKNTKVNGLLKKFGLKPRIVRLEDPNGFAKAGEFCVYDVPREVVQSWVL